MLFQFKYSIQPPVSSIQYLVSSIQYLASSILPLPPLHASAKVEAICITIFQLQTLDSDLASDTHFAIEDYRDILMN